MGKEKSSYLFILRNSEQSTLFGIFFSDLLGTVFLGLIKGHLHVSSCSQMFALLPRCFVFLPDASSSYQMLLLLLPIYFLFFTVHLLNRCFIFFADASSSSQVLPLLPRCFFFFTDASSSSQL